MAAALAHAQMPAGLTGVKFVVLRCAIKRTATYVSAFCYTCVLILLYMCHHTAIYVSSCCRMCVLMLLYVS